MRPRTRTVGKELEGIDWADVYKTLYAHARSLRWLWRVNETFDCGISDEDLVTETLSAFFESKNALGWKPGKAASPRTYLCTVLHNKFVDHLRRENKVSGSLDDEALKKHLRDDESPAPSAELMGLAEEMLAIVGGDDDLRELITAVELTDGRHNVNQQLADLLGKSTREIVNLKRRLLNVKGIRELYEQRREKLRLKA